MLDGLGARAWSPVTPGGRKSLHAVSTTGAAPAAADSLAHAGLAQGVGQGVVGVAANPISGVLEAVSTTFEGMDATTAAVLKRTRAAEQQRTRLQRPIGGDHRLLPFLRGAQEGSMSEKQVLAVGWTQKLVLLAAGHLLGSRALMTCMSLLGAGSLLCKRAECSHALQAGAPVHPACARAADSKPCTCLPVTSAPAAQHPGLICLSSRLGWRLWARHCCGGHRRVPAHRWAWCTCAAGARSWLPMPTRSTSCSLTTGLPC